MTPASTPTTGSSATTAASKPDSAPCADSTATTASVVIEGHAFVQNLLRGHYELGVHARTRHLRVAAAFDELATLI